MPDKYGNVTIEQIQVGMMEVNCYLVYDSGAKSGIVIDPGEDGYHILLRLQELDLQVAEIVLTHGHADHLGAIPYLSRKLDVRIMIGKNDAAMLTDPSLNLSSAFGEPLTLQPANRLLSEGDEVVVGSMRLKVLDTPGHTAGGISLVGEGFVIVGDLIFAGSIGRVDLPGGNYDLLINSVKNKILTLGDKVAIYPGHGPVTTVAQEKLFNPFLMGG